MKNIKTVIAIAVMLLMLKTLSAQNIVKLEYFIDTDPGFGLATTYPINPANDDTTVTFTIDVSAVTPGFHYLYIRSMDNNNLWSLTNIRSFYKETLDASINIVAMEYSIDTVPAFGQGTPIAVTPAPDINNLTATIDVSGVSPGFHKIYFRSKDANNKWSLCNIRTFYKEIAPAAMPNIIAMEYSIDTVPAFGQGTPIAITPSPDINNFNTTIDVSGTSEGFHKIYLRTKDANNKWSLCNIRTFYKETAVSLPNITKVEYYYDNDPGYGNGFNVPVTPALDLNNVNFMVNIDTLSFAFHHIYIRTMDSKNHWSLNSIDTFTFVPQSLVIVPAQTNVLCKTQCNGKAMLNFTSGNPPYQIDWYDATMTSISQINDTAVGLCAGVYYAVVTDRADSTDTVSFLITQPDELLTTITKVDATCGNANGSATAVVTGGTQPYSYHWSTLATTATITNIPASGYSVTVTDANGCIKVTTFSLPGHSKPIPNAIVTQNASCNGVCDGKCNVTVYGGTSPFNYIWNDDFNQNTAIVQNLCARMYKVTVTDFYGCTGIDSVTVTQPNPLIVNVTEINAQCGVANGSATALPSGGTSPYFYQWANGATTATVINLYSGNYPVTVTDFKGCQQFASAMISDLNGPSVAVISNVPVVCNGESNGSLEILVSGSAPPFTTTWSNGAITSSITNLIAGLYQVTVSDANGCSAYESYSIAQPDHIQLFFSTTPAPCNGSGGSATVLVLGGTSPYNYFWSSGDNAETAVSLISGVYTVDILDANFCTSTGMIAVSEVDGPQVIVTSVVDAYCGNASGAIDVSVSGGTSPYSFLWSNNAVTQNLSGIDGGMYSLTVTGNNGCHTYITQEVGFVRPQETNVCIVTVDSIAFKNRIIWEESSLTNISGYNIYKLSGSNYVFIGNVNATAPNEFIDYYSFPEVHADRYKVTVIDTCNNESDKSFYHQTISLGISQGVPITTIVLNWNHYIDESGIYAPSWYYIFKGTNQSNLALFDSISGAFTSYNDYNVFNTYYYVVAVKKQYACVVNSNSEYYSYSNLKDNSGLVGINELPVEQYLSISPNPFKEYTIIEIPDLIPNEQNQKLRITDVSGKIIFEKIGITERKYEFKRGALPSGIYFVEIRGEKVYRGKLIVE